MRLILVTILSVTLFACTAVDTTPTKDEIEISKQMGISVEEMRKLSNEEFSAKMKESMMVDESKQGEM